MSSECVCSHGERNTDTPYTPSHADTDTFAISVSDSVFEEYFIDFTRCTAFTVFDES